ncbi:MAG: sugar kinase [Rhodothermales bacterium]|nr:sugar kinase [Rhodothermales bacterium]
MSIVAVGTVALDTIETPFGRAENILGGSATFIALAARFFTDEVDLIAVVGNDFPTEHIEMLRARGVSTEGLQVDQSGTTFAWEGRYSYDLNDRETLATHLNVLSEFSPVIPERSRHRRLVCLGNLDPEIQQKVLMQMNDHDLVVCDTMNYWIERTPDELSKTLKLVDCLIINDAEARQLADEPNLIRAATAIRALGPRILVIKKGEHGALLFADGAIFSAPAFPMEDIHDPTGAGDSFMGGFAGYLAMSRDYSVDSLKRAVVYGSAMASFVVERFGTESLSLLSRDVIDRRVDAFRVLGEIPTISPLNPVA